MFDAVPNDATGYVAAAYIFFLVLVLIYIAIIGAKLERIGRDLSRLTDQVEDRPRPDEQSAQIQGDDGDE